MRAGTVQAMSFLMALGLVIASAAIMERHRPAPGTQNWGFPLVARPALDVPAAAPETPNAAPADAAAAAANATPAAAPAPQPNDALPDLPVQNIKPMAARPVPDTGPPPPSSYDYPEPVNPPRGAASGSYRNGAYSPGRTQSATPPTLSGPARAAGTVSIAIDGHIVTLFGVLPPASTDRCQRDRGDARSCFDVAQEVLAERIARSPQVTCRLPAGIGSTDPRRVCVDATGADLAAALVGEGLAIADRRQGRDYEFAEGSARKDRKGLWRYR